MYLYIKNKILILFFLSIYFISFAQNKEKEPLETQIINCKNYDCLNSLFKKLKNIEGMFLLKKNVPNVLPLELENIDLTSIYGNRFHPIDKKIKSHKGIDLKAPYGDFIYAPADGVVSVTKKSNYGYGNRIRIKHLYGFETFYAHLSYIYINQFDIVKKGDIIGFVGTSGKSTAPHLHYEVFKNNKNINPSFIIKNL